MRVSFSARHTSFNSTHTQAKTTTTHLGRNRDSHQWEGGAGGNDHVRVHVVVERVFDAHLLDERHLLGGNAVVFMRPATKHVGQESEAWRRNQAVVHLFVIGCFREKEVMNRGKGQDGVELTF